MAATVAPATARASRTGAAYLWDMEHPDRESLRQFAREHHVHYEVEPEEVIDAERREVIGWRLRLYAMHDEAKLEEPSCPRCVELTDELRALAARLAPDESAGDTAEVVPRAAPKLYRSTEAPDADEIAVTVRVLCGSPEHRAAGRSEERCLRPLARELEALGIPRR
jgi:hypothetical protein